MSKETLIIKKLLKIAQSQQKILAKLAQTIQDPNVEYLKRAAGDALMNSGINAHYFVTSKAGTSIDTPSGNKAETATEYTVTVSGAPSDNALRQKFMDTLKTQIKTQKPNQPELANLSILFSDTGSVQ